MRFARLAILTLLLIWTVPAWSEPLVAIETSRGEIKLELYADKAPETVKNFVSYAESGYYDGTIFHRVIDNFMIQGGGFTTDLKQKETRSPIRNEADNGLRNDRGTIAMARTPIVDSATSQFFINLKDNSFLNHSGKSAQQYGYAVFGRVISGMEVVDAIGHSAVANRGGAFQNLPVDQVVIRSVKILGK